MAQRMSVAEQVSRNDLAVKGGKKYAAKLPKETQPFVASLEVRNANISKLNAEQEGAKQALAKLTEALRAEVKAASADRARVVKAAEFIFGARSPELKEFRPTTEGRTRAGS